MWKGFKTLYIFLATCVIILTACAVLANKKTEVEVAHATANVFELPIPETNAPDYCCIVKHAFYFEQARDYLESTYPECIGNVYYYTSNETPNAPCVQGACKVRLAWHFSLLGAKYSVSIYYPERTHVYTGFLPAYGDEVRHPNRVEHNPLIPGNSCIPDVYDSNAEPHGGGPCGYYACYPGAVWSLPASEDYNVTCDLNPLFHFPTGEYELGEPVIEDEGVDTAIGCFPTTPKGIVTAVLRIFMGIAGLVALGIIITNIIRIMTGSDNPETVKDAYSRITYAAIGLVVIILSVFILRFIGIHILNLPQFGGSTLEQIGG